MSAVAEEVKAEDGKAEPEKKHFYCEVSGFLRWVFSPGARGRALEGVRGLGTALPDTGS